MDSFGSTVDLRAFNQRPGLAHGEGNVQSIMSSPSSLLLACTWLEQHPDQPKLHKQGMECSVNVVVVVC